MNFYNQYRITTNISYTIISCNNSVFKARGGGGEGQKPPTNQHRRGFLPRVGPHNVNRRVFHVNLIFLAYTLYSIHKPTMEIF